MSDMTQFWLDVRAGLLQIVDAIERLPEANVHPTTAELRRQVRQDYRRREAYFEPQPARPERHKECVSG